ncbi:MAG: response regulator transcription factor [Betaproteobacteria bacterium]|nr:response regulator transcription factor [Betaproteobacteria bacterium]
MTPTAIIADDEQHLAAYLNDRLAALWPELNVVGVARNGLEAMKLMDDEAPAIAFLDIRMPGLTGLEVASRLDNKTHVVFVTAYDQYAVEAFDQQAADYLLKPVTDDRLRRAIDRLKQRLSKAEAPGDVAGILKQLAQMMPPSKNAYLRFIRAAHGEVVRQIPVEDVNYLQAQDKYVSVYTKEGESLIRTPLSELSAQLDPNEFWQIHRSVIVNVNRVAATRRDVMGKVFVKLKDAKTELPVSRAYVHLFKGM